VLQALNPMPKDHGRVASITTKTKEIAMKIYGVFVPLARCRQDQRCYAKHSTLFDMVGLSCIAKKPQRECPSYQLFTVLQA
jgi:hypothetical protein